MPRQKDGQCRRQDEQKMGQVFLTSCCWCWMRQVKSSLFLSLHSAHLYLYCSFLSVAMALLHVEPRKTCEKECVNPVFDSWWASYLRNVNSELWWDVVWWWNFSGWMDELCSSVVVLLFQLRVIAAVQVTRGKLFCSTYSLEVQEVIWALYCSSEVWISSLFLPKNRWCLVLSGTLFISQNS